MMQLLFSRSHGQIYSESYDRCSISFKLSKDNFFPFSQLSKYFVMYLAGYFSVSRTIHSIAAIRFSSVGRHDLGPGNDELLG
jgi:hypothetical protein